MRCDEDAVRIAGEQLIPLAAPDDLDDVPTGAAEDSFQLLDDLAVAAHRTIEPLEVAVDDEDEVVQTLARGDGERAEGLGLVSLPVADEGPHPVLRRVLDAAVVQVAVEARLVDGGQRRQAHGHRGELPEVGHEARMRVGGEAGARLDLSAEVVELRFGRAGPRGRRARRRPGAAWPWKKTWSPMPSASLPRKKWLKPTS